MAEPLVLVVDDDRNVRETIRDFLDLEGVPVRAVGPEDQDLEALVRDEPVGCVVTDLNMPGLDGLAVVRLVLRVGKDLGRRIPVYVLTGAGGEARLEEVLQEGAAGWFPKPPDLDDFLSRIREALASGDPRT